MTDSRYLEESMGDSPGQTFDPKTLLHSRSEVEDYVGSFTDRPYQTFNRKLSRNYQDNTRMNTVAWGQIVYWRYHWAFSKGRCKGKQGQFQNDWRFPILRMLLITKFNVFSIFYAFTRPGGVRSTIFNLLNATAGAAVIAMPGAFRASGLSLSFFQLILACFVNFVSSSCLVDHFDPSSTHPLNGIAFPTVSWQWTATIKDSLVSSTSSSSSTFSAPRSATPYWFKATWSQVSLFSETSTGLQCRKSWMTQALFSGLYSSR